MANWQKYGALLLILGASRLEAGFMRPYDTVLLEYNYESPTRDQDALIIVDMETGTHTRIPVEIPIEGPYGLNQPTIAVDLDGASYVYFGFLRTLDIGGGSLLARLDPTMTEWTTTIIQPSVDFPNDMEFMPDGNLITSAEFGLHVLDLGEEAAGPPFLPNIESDLDFEPQPTGIEIDTAGTYITGFTGVLRDPIAQTSVLFRQTPEAEYAERFDTGILLTDFVLDSDGSLIGIVSRDAVSSQELDTATLYRLNFETKGVDVLLESDLLKGTHRIHLDPAGRIVALAQSGNSTVQIVRVDLELGTADVITELQGRILFDMDLRVLPMSSLFAGDADQDLDFDQFDLIKVLQAAKYLTAQPATWGEGDWDGAPGGSQGEPPAGNGRFDQLDIIGALAPGHYLTGSYAAIEQGGTAGDDRTSIIYNPTTGGLAIDAPIELTSINIDSAAGIFTGDAAQNLGGSFDNDSDTNIFKATFGSSFGSLTFGNVAQTGLSEDFMLNDLTVVGSLAGGGDLGDVDLIYVPEPWSVILLALGIIAVAGYRCCTPAISARRGWHSL